MIRPGVRSLLVACAVVSGACEQRAHEPIAPAQIFDAVQATPRLTDVALPLPLRSVARLRSHSIVTHSGVSERVGAVDVFYTGDAARYDEAATADTEIHTVSATWRVGSDDSVRVLHTRFSSAITRTLAREGECFARPRYYPPGPLVTRWPNGEGAVWLHWKLTDTVPSPNGPIAYPPTLSVGVTLRARSLHDYFERLIPSPCT